MSSGAVVDIVGWIGSGLIVTSLTMKSLLKLRMVGVAGATVFVAYGVLLEAYPIAIVNTVIVGIHIYFLRKLLGPKHELFTALEVHKNSRYLRHFLGYYAEDIGRFQPDFAFAPADDQLRAFILRDMVPAGLFIGRDCRDGSVEAQLDFVIPQYRDFKVGAYLFSLEAGVFGGVRCSRIWSRPGTETHAAYLKRMGFVPERTADGDLIYAIQVGDGAGPLGAAGAP